MDFSLRRSCIAFVVATFFVAATPSSRPTPAATPNANTCPCPSPPSGSPQLIPFASESGTPAHVVYVLATSAAGESQSVRNKVLAGFTEEMQKRVIRNAPMLIPMPDWSLEEFVQACAQTANGMYHVDGALIVRVFSVSYWVSHKAFQEAPTTAIDADAFYAECQTSNPASGPVYTWHDATEYRDGTVGITNLSSLALLVPAVALYQAFIPSKTQTTVLTKPFLQPTPLPSGSEVTTVSGTYNPSGAGNSAVLATALIAPALNYTQALTSTPPPQNDQATWAAVNHLSAQIAADTICPTSSPAANATAPPTPMPGATPALFCQTPAPASPRK